MKKLKCTLLKLMIAVSAFMFAHACHAQTNGNPSALDYGSYGSLMNRQQLNQRNTLDKGNLHIGSLEIHPSFHDRVMYDDNIFKVSGTNRKMQGQDSITSNTSRENESKESDIINIASPGLRLALPLGERFLYGKIKKLGLNWQSDIRTYTDDNASQNADNHYIVGSVTLEVLKGFDLTLNQNFQHTNTGAGSETDQLHRRNTNSSGIALRMSQIIHSLKKLDIEVAYRNFDQDYSETQLERANRNQDDYSFNLYYTITPKLSINSKYTYSVIEYDKDRAEAGINTDALSDSHTNTITGGVVWKATAKTTGHFNIGYTDREYEKNVHQGFDLDPSALWRTSDVNSFVMDGGVTTRLPWNTILDVNVYRQLREAEFTAKSNSYFSTGGSFSLSNQFRKLKSDFSANYFVTDFNGVNRRDNIFTLAFNTSYAITKWSQVEAGYSWKKKDTNIDFDREDEEINQAYFGLGFGL